MTTCPTCGRTTPGKPRSVEAHRRYFAIFQALWSNLPEEWHNEISSQEELRKLMEMRAGYYDRIDIDLDGADPAQAVVMAQAAMRAAGSYARARVIDGKLVVFKPRSIRFDVMGQREFNELSAKVELTIEQQTGLRVEELLKAADGP